jgi:Rel/ankyrin family protein
LKICRLSTAVSSAEGGDEVFMFVEKVCKNNIKIRFFEVDDLENEIWFDWGVFSEVDVHHQYAIAFKTPAYKNKDINESVEVFVQLYRPRDGCRSEPIPFKIKPKNLNPSSRKRQRTISCSSSDIPTVVQDAPSFTQASSNTNDYTISKEYNKSDIIQEILDSHMACSGSNEFFFNSSDFKYLDQFDSEELSKIVSEISHSQELSKLETDAVGRESPVTDFDRLFNEFKAKVTNEAEVTLLGKIIMTVKIFEKNHEKQRRMLSALWMGSNIDGIK